MTAVIGPDGKFVDVTPEQLEQLNAVKDAAVAPPASSGPQKMIGTDGKLYNVPESSYQTAIKQGWKVADQKTVQRENEIEGRVKNTGQFEGGFKTFANEALLGIPEYISNKEAGPEQAAIDEEVRNRVAKRDPTTHSIAAGLGFIAPLAVPGVGEVGEAARVAALGGKVLTRGAEELAAKGAIRGVEELTAEQVVKSAAEHAVAQKAEASFTRKIASSSADYAAQSAVFASPKAAVQVAYGDDQQAAETMLWGIGLGGLVGGAAGAIGVGLKGAAKLAAEKTESLQSKLSEVQPNGITLADDLSRNVLGITDKQAKKMGPSKVAELVENADNKGILRSGTVMKKAEELADKSGSEIKAHLEKLDTHLEDPDIRKLVTSPADVANQLQKEALERFPELSMETHASQMNELSKIVQDIGAGGEEASFAKLQEIRTGLQKGKKAFMSDSPNAEIYRFADRIIKQNIETGAEAVYKAGEEAAAFPQYLAAKKDYWTASQILKNQNEFKGTGRFPTIESVLGYGSSGVNAFGGLATAIASGHPLVAAGIGASLAGKYAISKITKNPSFRGYVASTLRQIGNDPASVPILGGLLAKEGQAALAQHIETIPDLLIHKGGKPTAVASFNAIQSFLGDEARGLSKDQQFKRVTDHITALVVDGKTTSENVGHIAEVFSSTSPKLAQLVADKKIAAIGYLASQVPKDPNPPTPFQKSSWKPNKQDQLVFERKLAIVMNPMIIWNYMQDHSITAADKETLKAVYPKIYESMMNKLMATAYDPRTPDVSHKMRMAASTFSDIPMDPSLKNIGKIQKAVKSGGHSQSPSPRPDMKAPSLTTTTQRLSNK